MTQALVRPFPPHLDAPLSKGEAERLVSDPTLVAQHPFYPFLQRNQRWTKFALKNARPEEVEKKDRPIRYAARRDSYIFAHYRRLLYPLYELELQRLGISECVLAYRRIPINGRRGGKCNIHFAGQAFQLIRSLGDCFVFALDISHFFETLDHLQIKRNWARLLGIAHPGGECRLPDDHYSVFKAVTRYSCIDRDLAYRELGLIGETTSAQGRKQIKFLAARENFPMQICTPSIFRERLSPLIERNENPFGIPQGSPISDLLANLYLIDFDCKLNALARSWNGKYLRYSDDLLLVLPGAVGDWAAVLREAESALHREAPRLQIKHEKTQVYRYEREDVGPDQSNKRLDHPTGPDGLEYLGFRYDGKHIYIRNSTVSGLRRKITASAKRSAYNHVKFHPEMTLAELTDSFNYDVLITKFGRVPDFKSARGRYETWTFWTYAKRSIEILGELSSPIQRQIGDYKAFARKRAKELIAKAYSRNC
jgi:hypothetical protein